MGIIRQMSEQLANQIAAGEVVERPSSVVKELVENAIDAGSRLIRVELVEAGIQKIIISDDGIGMDEQDLKLSILPHATSKIYDVHDLFQIHSLGFRGEALASIASVSKMTIESTLNQEDSVATKGYFIKVAGSQIIEEGATPPRPGTVMTVESLFYNTPARLKHLSSIKTELRHSANFIQQIALAYPYIRFTLINDGIQLFSSYGTGDLRQAIANVYQATIARQLLPIEGKNDDFIISGYISPPQLTRTSKHYIHWLINGRVVQSYVLSQMLLKAYGRQLMIGRYPIAIINIELDPQLVDVNVHPTKQTVRLSKETELTELLVKVVEKVLQQVNSVPQLQLEDVKPISVEEKTKVHYQNLSLDLTATPFVAEQITPIEQQMKEGNLSVEKEDTFEVEDPSLSFAGDQVEELEDVSVNSEEEHSLEAIFDTTKIPFYDLRYVGQIHGTYLIAESDTGFYLIDQHAAQERIRYERLMKKEANEFSQQHLLLPYILQFSTADASAVEDLLPKFEQLGLYLTAFGPNTYQLDSYPDWLEETQVEKTVYDLVNLLKEFPNLTINQLQEKTIIMQSCRGAIKANHYLSDMEAQALIRDMAHLDDPYHCPHGRPVFVEFNQTTLEKLFKRIQDSHYSGHQL